MRRIPLALALVGAVAVTGCMGGGKSSSTGSDGQQGVVGVNYYINVASPAGGYISSDVGSIVCGKGIDVVCSVSFQWNQTVVLTANPSGSNALIAWTGDCAGAGLTCTINAADANGVKNPGADKTVGAVFGPPGSGHGNFLEASVHGPAYWTWYNDPAGATLKCSACHGPSLAGNGIAPSCSSCHSAPPLPGVAYTTGHMNPLAPAMQGHNTGTCARCHNSGGFRDFMGADGTARNEINYGPGALPSTDVTTFPAPGPLVCNSCHNSATDPATGTAAKTHKFASGNVLTMDAATAICAQCHDGGRPGYEIAQLNSVLAANSTVGEDGQLTTSNATVRAHYFVAASTLFGAEAAAYVQYPGKVYTARNQHGVIAGSCVACHDPHTTSVVPVTASSCGRCHFNEATGLPVANFTELEESRQFGFEGVDVDGDGTVESLKNELLGLGDVVYGRIQKYGEKIAGTPICVGNNRAYILSDPAVACGTAPNAVAYNKFTPRLLKAVFNYLMWQNDTGAWAHNPRYAVEVAYDTAMDLNGALLAADQIDFQGYRSFEGHFGGVHTSTHLQPVDHTGSEAFHDWDPGPVGTACAQCHGGQKGIEKYLGATAAGNVAMAATPAISPVTGFECTTCHAPVVGDTSFFRMRSIPTVYFPGQKLPAKSVAKIASDFSKPADMVCSTCHTGRENRTSVQDKTCLPAGSATCVDVTTFSVGATNPHYLGAAGVLFGSETAMLYQYAGKTYTGKAGFFVNAHGSPHAGSCIGCHQPKASKHTFEADLLVYCASCHKPYAAGEQYPGSPAADYSLAPLKANIATLAAEAYAALQAYQALNLNPIIYDGAAYPYWYADTNGNGIREATETGAAKFDAKGARAAFNYKWAVAEPGAYAHNYEYIAEILFDTIKDLGGTPSITPATRVTP